MFPSLASPLGWADEFLFLHDQARTVKKYFKSLYNKHFHKLLFFLYVQRICPAAAKLLQSCPTLCNLRDGSPPGSPVPGILQARTLEWVAISFSNA